MKSPDPAAADGGVTAVDRALSIVLAAETAAMPITLAELARRTGLYKSTLLRLLTSLGKVGLITRNSEGCYSLGPLAFRLGRAYEATYQVRGHVMPVLQRLVDMGTESASFHVRQDERQRLCMFRVDSHHSTLDSVRAGDLLSLHRGAPGRVLITFGQTTDAAKIARLNPATISDGERDPMCAAIACPVFGPYHEVYGALSLSGPRERYTEAATARMTKLLTDAARDVTHSLGGIWPWQDRSLNRETA